MADMTYSDSAASIRNNTWFRSRVEISLSKYSNYLLNTPDTDAEYEAKTNYGTRIAQSSSMIVDSLMFTLGGDAEILAAGPAIADTQLQSIVEKTVPKVFPPTPATPPAMSYAQGGRLAVEPQHWTSIPAKPV